MTTGTGKTFRIGEIQKVETPLEDCIEALLAPPWQGGSGSLQCVVSAKIGCDILWHLRNYQHLLEHPE